MKTKRPRRKLTYAERKALQTASLPEYIRLRRKMMKKKQRNNPQDATLRNVRATRRHQAALELRLERIEAELRSINSHLVLRPHRR